MSKDNKTEIQQAQEFVHMVQDVVKERSIIDITDSQFWIKLTNSLKKHKDPIPAWKLPRCTSSAEVTTLSN